MVSVWSTKVISRSPHMFISRLLTSCALLFRLSFRGTISYIITAFVSNFNDSVRSVTDIDIWLAVLLILSSFVPTSNIMWLGLNYQMVALTWSYIQLTLTPLNDRTLISVLFRIFFYVKRYPFTFVTILYPSMTAIFLVLLTCLELFSYTKPSFSLHFRFKWTPLLTFDLKATQPAFNYSKSTMKY